MSSQDTPSVSPIINLALRGAVVVFNIFGNSLILVAVTRSKVFNRLTRHLISHVALADLVFGVAVGMHSILLYGGLMTYEACIIVCLFLLSSGACSGLGICLVLVENYMSVRQINSQTGMKITLPMAWGFTISFWIIMLSLGITYFASLPEFDYDDRLCDISSPYFTKKFLIIQVVMTNLILFIMLFLMFQMMLIVKKNLRNLFQEESSAANLMKQRSMQKKSRLARLFMMIIFGFVVNWGPNDVALTTVLICPGCISADLLRASSLTLPINACVNVVVYAIKDKQFREVCKKLLRAKFHQVADVDSTTASNRSGS